MANIPSVIEYLLELEKRKMIACHCHNTTYNNTTPHLETFVLDKLNEEYKTKTPLWREPLIRIASTLPIKAPTNMASARDYLSELNDKFDTFREGVIKSFNTRKYLQASHAYRGDSSKFKIIRQGQKNLLVLAMLRITDIQGYEFKEKLWPKNLSEKNTYTGRRAGYDAALTIVSVPDKKYLKVDFTSTRLDCLKNDNLRIH